MYTFYELHTNTEDIMIVTTILATPFSHHHHHKLMEEIIEFWKKSDKIEQWGKKN